MNGRMAKKLRRITPLLVLDLHQKAAAAHEVDPNSVDLSALPTVRQVYRKLKHKYEPGQ